MPRVTFLLIVALFLTPLRAGADTINACANKTNGNLRLVADLGQCKNNEAPISWNSEGPEGPPGPPGEAICGVSSGPLPATGQTTCWNSNGNEIPCSGTGHDGEIQAGSALSYVDNGDGTISDLNTGLMWEKKSNDGSANDVDFKFDWTDAFSHVLILNQTAFAGYTDWRLPNIRELTSLFDYSRTYPGAAIHPAFNTDCEPLCMVLTCSCIGATQPDYWSSTTYVSTPERAWYGIFNFGFVNDAPKTVDPLLRVRAVRGGL